MDEEGDQVQVWNVVFTKKVTQKQKNGWIDGVATINYQKGRNITTINVVDEDSKQVTRGRIPPDKLPIDEDSEIVVAPILIRFNELVSTTNTSLQPERPQVTMTIQRPGLRRMPTTGFKPPNRITPIIQEKLKHEEEFPKPIEDRKPKKPVISDELKKYEVYHYRGDYPKLNNIEPQQPQTVVRTELKVIKTDEEEILKREIPRTFDEIMEFLTVNPKEEKITPQLTKGDDSPSKQHTSAKDILAAFQRTQSASSSDNERGTIISQFDDDEEIVKETPLLTKNTNFDQSSDSPLEDDEDNQNEPIKINADQNQQLDASQIRIDMKWDEQKKNYSTAIAETFNTYEEYRDAFVQALTTEINVKIREIYLLYAGARFAALYKAPICQVKGHGQMKFGIDKKGGYYYHCTSPQCKSYKPIPQDMEIPAERKVPRAPVVAFLRSRGIFSADATFQRTKNMKFLSVGNPGGDFDFSKDDVWILLTDDGNYVFACAEGYGIGRGNKIYLDNFFDDLMKLPMTTKCLAIRLFNAQSEKAAILKLYNANDVPIIPSILNASNAQPMDMGSLDVMQIAKRTAEEYRLNECQTDALMKVAQSINGENPILLVHGIFGAGKSHLLSVIVIYLDKILNMANKDDKILIAATTNVAVDNILLNLVENGFENITRVGSVKNMSRKILPYATGNSDADAIGELKALQSVDPNKEIELAIQNAQQESLTKTSKIDICRVTGVTCAATSFAVMMNRKFSFVLLDECSQQPEPISFLPVSFGCQRLICCGDPMQLPPTISSHAPLGYGRPLFSRLMKRFPPVMLNMQYRCHPAIADICSRLFYRGKVVSGVSEEDRHPLLGMPTIALFNVDKGVEQSRRGSFVNDQEASTAISLVRCLINRGIPADQIGVICFYKAQCEAIASPLTEGKHPIVDVSTVDAFQGDEREVIIINTCRTNMSSFVEMNERVNVAISRAKRHLFIISNAAKLNMSNIWGTVFMAASKPPNKVYQVEMPLPLMWDPFPPIEQEE